MTQNPVCQLIIKAYENNTISLDQAKQEFMEYAFYLALKYQESGMSRTEAIAKAIQHISGKENYGRLFA